jgi:hypothetical protein
MTTERFVGAFFGEPWPSGVCDEGIQVVTPVGEECIFCETPIEPTDQGSFIGSLEDLIPAHKECSLRSVMGGIGHLRDHFFWCRDKGDPDGGLGYRESALQVWRYMRGE